MSEIFSKDKVPVRQYNDGNKVTTTKNTMLQQIMKEQNFEGLNFKRTNYEEKNAIVHFK